MSAGQHPLIVATDRPPLAEPASGSAGFERAHAALMHTVASRGGAWVAATAAPAAPANSWLHPVHVEGDLLEAHRDGYCGQTLASVYFGHDGPTPPQRATWADAYREVNSRYARAIASLAAPGAAVWLHDHPLQLVPGALRALRPDLRIGLFLHSPFPPAETFLTLAGRDPILAGLLATDLVGFTDVRSAANLTGLAQTTGQPPPRTTVMPMPAETHAVVHLAATVRVQALAARLRSRLRPATTVFLSIGGHDSGDGTAAALSEYGRLLDERGLDPRGTALIHLAPAGTVENGLQHKEIERLTAQINGRHGRLGHLPVHYQRQDLSLAELTAFYLCADVMLAVPMRDRATPHAAEYVAARRSGRGRVILGELSSAVAQLPAATVINPHEPGALARAMRTAAAEAKTRCPRMVAMRENAIAYGVGQWAQQFLHALTGTNGTVRELRPSHSDRLLRVVG